MWLAAMEIDAPSALLFEFELLLPQSRPGSFSNFADILWLFV